MVAVVVAGEAEGEAEAEAEAEAEDTYYTLKQNVSCFGPCSGNKNEHLPRTELVGSSVFGPWRTWIAVQICGGTVGSVAVTDRGRALHEPVVLTIVSYDRAGHRSTGVPTSVVTGGCT